MEQDVPLSARAGLRAPHWIVTLRGWPWQAAAPGIVVAVLALALRLALIWCYPLLYDGDAYGRWLDRDHPFRSIWVPFFQVCIYLLTRLADSILAVQLLSIFFGAAAALAFWLLLRRAFGPATAYLGALLLALNPLFVLFSIVPYQEGLFLSLASLALWLALAPGRVRWPWLALVVGLAALTRYEGWLLALLLWLLFLWRRRRAGALTWRFAAGSALALAWAPLLWILINRNVSPQGTETLAPTLDPASLLTTLRALWPEWSLHLGLAGGLLALAGLIWLGWRAARGSELAWLLLGFLLGDLLILAFLRPFSPGNLRLPLLSLPVVLTGMAGLASDMARLAVSIAASPSARLANKSPKGGTVAPKGLRAAKSAYADWVLAPVDTWCGRESAQADLVAPAGASSRDLQSPGSVARIKRETSLFASPFGACALVTAVLLLWLVPIAVQQVAAYDALVRPAYQAADDLPRALPSNAPIALFGNETDIYAFLVYARQEGWQGNFTELTPTYTSTPALLEAALSVVHARLLVIYGPAATSAPVRTLAQEGLLAPTGQGPGYALWLVQLPRPGTS